jgi:O-6-methylguanine DNA methyltransferase
MSRSAPTHHSPRARARLDVHDVRHRIVATARFVAHVAATARGLCLVALGPPDGDAAELFARVEAWQRRFEPRADLVADRRLLPDVVLALRRHAAGHAVDFGAFDLDLRGTPFQSSVWNAVRRLPRGTTCTFGALASRVGRPTACRAVGRAIAANPLPLVVPCHRVLGAAGLHAGSYSGCLRAAEVKRALLALEGVHVDEEPSRRRSMRGRADAARTDTAGVGW